MFGPVSQLEMMPVVAALILFDRLSIDAIAMIALIIVLTPMLFLLAVGFGVIWAWHRVMGKAESFGRTWRLFRSVVLGLSAAAWLVLTIYAAVEPLNPQNEISAIAQLRTINTAEVTYQADHNDTYGTIPELISAGVLDARFESSVSGYVYNVTVSDRDYTVTALPVSTKAGKYGYYSASDAVVRYARTVTKTCKPCYPRGMSGEPVT
jgi:hypothetical protein